MTSDGVPEQTKLSLNYFIAVKVTQCMSTWTKSLECVTKY